MTLQRRPLPVSAGKTLNELAHVVCSVSSSHSFHVENELPTAGRNGLLWGKIFELSAGTVSDHRPLPRKDAMQRSGDAGCPKISACVRSVKERRVRQADVRPARAEFLDATKPT